MAIVLGCELGWGRAGIADAVFILGPVCGAGKREPIKAVQNRVKWTTIWEGVYHVKGILIGQQLY